jgi:hypothetical protein
MRFALYVLLAAASLSPAVAQEFTIASEVASGYISHAGEAEFGLPDLVLRQSHTLHGGFTSGLAAVTARMVYTDLRHQRAAYENDAEIAGEVAARLDLGDWGALRAGYAISHESEGTALDLGVLALAYRAETLVDAVSLGWHGAGGLEAPRLDLTLRRTQPGEARFAIGLIDPVRLDARQTIAELSAQSGWAPWQGAALLAGGGFAHASVPFEDQDFYGRYPADRWRGFVGGQADGQGAYALKALGGIDIAVPQERPDLWRGVPYADVALTFALAPVSLELAAQLSADIDAPLDGVASRRTAIAGGLGLAFGELLSARLVGRAVNEAGLYGLDLYETRRDIELSFSHAGPHGLSQSLTLARSLRETEATGFTLTSVMVALAAKM